MLSLICVWLGLTSLTISLTMLFYRPAFNDLLLAINLWLSCPLTLTLGGLVLWATRKDKPRNRMARLQCLVGSSMACVAAGLIYLLVHFAQRIEPP